MGIDLHERSITGLQLEIALFGSGANNEMLPLPGVTASVSPATPDRSVFNSVYATDVEALEDSIDGLASAYEEAGVRAWTVWIPDGDRPSAELLERRGHVLDSWPRSMGLELKDLRIPDRPLAPNTHLTEGDFSEIGRLNDLAYGIEGPGWGAAIDRAPDLPFRSLLAVIDGEVVACALVLDGEDDASVTCVATDPDHQGKGLASALIARLLGDARDRGMKTGTLQASAAGAPVYTRLGFQDVGFFEMWELRKPD